MLETGLSKDSKKAKLLDNLFQSIDREFGDSGSVQPFYKWVEGSGLTLDSKPFSFWNHEYLKTPYQDDHPYQVHLKGAQLGITSLAMLRVLYGARYRGFKGILYLFPSRTDALDFSRGRVSPLIEQNENIATWVKETDSAGLKAIWNCWLYIRGMRSRTGLKSIPIDFLICDELDEADPQMLDIAKERMGHSEFKELLMLSNPTLPDYGVSKEFDLTDQRYWLLKCEKCGEFTCLENTFPDCLLEVDGRVIRACSKCKAELNPAIGEWVAKKPGVTDKRGYHYSQLFSQFVDPAEILHQFRTTNNRQDFYNLKIGIPWIEAENRLSVEEVLNLCRLDIIVSTDGGPCFMGVDQGKDFHVVIGKKHPQKAGKIIHLGIYKEWEELGHLMKNFNISRCVVDALPETRNARAFAEGFKGKVFLNYYSQYQKGSYTWNEQQMTVSSN